MACEGKNLAYIHFEYPGEEQQTIKSTNPPVNYQCKFDGQFDGGQCLTTYYFRWRYPNGANFLLSFNPESFGHTALNGKIVSIVCTGEYYRNGFFRGHTFAIANELGEQTVGTADAGDLPRGTLPPVITPERIDGQPDNCGNPPAKNKYKFTVTDATQTIYSRSANVCPIVDIKCGESCPPGTCECDCRNVICCYNNNGILVKSFAK